MDKGCWSVDKPVSRRKLKEEARLSGETIHFGDLMSLCHEKHSEIKKDKPIYKGRVVFRGDNVRDESGYLAAFSEQGTSASHMAAAKMLDAISRLPDCDGENADATSAYTQSTLGGPATWIRLPRDRQPTSWRKFRDPLCRLRLSLYGHPLAGLYWQQHCRKNILKCGFKPVKGWECLFQHPDQQFFLSIYVDDFLLSGSKEEMAKTWERLRDPKFGNIVGGTEISGRKIVSRVQDGTQCCFTRDRGR